MVTGERMGGGITEKGKRIWREKKGNENKEGREQKQQQGGVLPFPWCRKLKTSATAVVVGRFRGKWVRRGEVER